MEAFDVPQPCVKGGTSTLQCLNPAPTWIGTKRSSTAGALLYETEYQAGDTGGEECTVIQA